MNDVVIVDAVRSPCGRYKKGGLAATRADEIGVQTVRGLMARNPALTGEEVDDLIVGCSFPEGEQGLNLGRILALGAGLPASVPGMTVNRFCASGLQSLAEASASIKSGWSRIVIAGGCESMSHVPMGGNILRPCPDWTDLPNPYIAMGATAENIARIHNVSRQDQDAFALESHRRAWEAGGKGRFDDEIVPIDAWRYLKDEGGGRRREKFRFHKDDGVRWPLAPDELAERPPAFRAGGSVTAGNSSQMTDGAAFALLMSKEKAGELGIKPLAMLSHYSVVGCAPEMMGIGPVPAVTRVLDAAGLGMGDIDLFEINEAFASQIIYCLRALGLEERWRRGDVNPNGGAIALGHPLGATGTRLTVSLLQEMKKRGAKRGIVSMCVGGGMGAAGIFEMV